MLALLKQKGKRNEWLLPISPESPETEQTLGVFRTKEGGNTKFPRKFPRKSLKIYKKLEKWEKDLLHYKKLEFIKN